MGPLGRWVGFPCFVQLLFKGYMHHVWGRRIAVVLQGKALDYIESTVSLATVPTLRGADIVILPYRYVDDPADPAKYLLELVPDRILRVPYASFAPATLSIDVPDVGEFLSVVQRRLL